MVAPIASSRSYSPGSAAIRRSVASPAAVTTGLPASVPAWYTGPSGAIRRIRSARTPVGGGRGSAGDHLPEAGQVGGDPDTAPGRRRGRAGTRSSPRRTRAAPRARRTATAAPSRKPGTGGTTPMLPGHRLDDDGGHVARRPSARSTESRSLNRATRVSAAVAAGTPGLSGSAKVARPAAGTDQERVGVTVVAALELDHTGPPGGGAGQTDRRCGRLGARVDHAHHLDARHQRHDRSASSTSAAVGTPNEVPRPAASGQRRRPPRGSACPRIRAPHEAMKSMSSTPSTVVTTEPAAEATNGGCPPTALNARTGELTPPGMTDRARLEQLPGRGSLPAPAGGPP